MTPTPVSKETAFIEHISLLAGERGLPRSTGKVLGLLLICEPRYQSAEAIQQRLKISTGSVSTALQLLHRLDLVNKQTFPGDRRFYYELAPDCWKRLIETGRRQMKWGIELANEGLSFSKGNDRLEGMRQLYTVSVELLDNLNL